jgi:hypothetical protein
VNALVVCVDNLLPDEFEFFSLARRVGAIDSIYVYGSVHSEQSVRSAIEAGATGRATPEIVRSLLKPPEQSPPAASPPEPTRPRATEPQVAASFRPSESAPEPVSHDVVEERSEGTPVEPSPASSSAEPQAPSPAPEADAETERHQAEPLPSGEARVPWLHYADRPKRAAPQRHAPPQSAPTSDESRAQAAKTHEPLLTEAELRALMGDDISAIAPAEDADPGDARDEPERDDP